MKSLKRGLVYGLLTWIVPFVSSWGLYSRDGQPLYDIFLIKTLLLVVFSAFGAVLLVSYFSRVQERFLHEGLMVGLLWLAINWALDILVLLPMMGESLATYMSQIGLRYLIMPTMSVSMGYLLEKKSIGGKAQ